MTKSFNEAINDLTLDEMPTPPVSVLDQLASTLKRKTRRTDLEFEVSSTTTTPDRVAHILRAVLHRFEYRLDLLSVSHEVTKLYPSRISGVLVPNIVEAQNEQALFDILVAAVNSDRAKELIGTLIAQTRY